MTDPGRSETLEQRNRRLREMLTIQQAVAQNRCISYIDTDGCEVTCTPNGNAFYNSADWY